MATMYSMSNWFAILPVSLCKHSPNYDGYYRTGRKAWMEWVTRLKGNDGTVIYVK